ncbi:MAG: hypothetical protein NPMRTH4_360009 [Nitrosopumilales archaeon]|nr:MAG: hypothetical protein NPMRTH4_360009 [Nitrosopumilales archaeon]
MLRLTEILKFNQNWALNNKPIRLKCPKCLADCSNSRQVKIFKTVRGLIRHLSLVHKGEFWIGDAKYVLKQVAIALDSGMIAQ